MKTMFFAAATALLACIFFVACTLHSQTGCAAAELARIMTARSESSCKARRRGDAEASAMRRNAAGGFRTYRPDGAAALCVVFCVPYGCPYLQIRALPRALIRPKMDAIKCKDMSETLH